MRNKLIELEHEYHFLCFNEYWLPLEELSVVGICGFSVVSKHCRTQKRHGEVCVFVNNNVTCKFLPFTDTFSEYFNFDAGGVISNNLQVADCHFV